MNNITYKCRLGSRLHRVRVPNKDYGRRRVALPLRNSDKLGQEL